MANNYPVKAPGIGASSFQTMNIRKLAEHGDQCMCRTLALAVGCTADGNTVEMDVERQKFSENIADVPVFPSRVSGYFKRFIELLQNLK